MDTWIWIVIAAVVVAAVVLVAAAAFAGRRRRGHLKERFGPEYDRTVEGADSRKDAERDLAARTKRHDSLDIKPLPSGIRDRYAREWTSVQEEFVDRPEDAVHDADSLVGSLMRDRGYPTENFDQQVKDLSVEHGRTLDHYRAAHEVNDLSTRHEATTEQLRGAMVHYRALFDELLTDGGGRRHARA
jgi:hypothetical protein